MGRGKKTAEQVEATRESIRQMLRLRARPHEIMKQLEMPRSTLFDHLRAIRDEDKKRSDEHAQGQFVSDYFLCMEAIENRIRHLTLAAESPQAMLRDKVAADVAIEQMELDRLELILKGPAIWAMKNKVDIEATRSALERERAEASAPKAS